MKEDIIWQREIKNMDDLSSQLDQDLENKIIQLPNGFFLIYQNYDEIKNILSKFDSDLNLNLNNNNSNLEKPASLFSISDLCCNLHVYIKRFFSKDQKLSDQINYSINQNNNNQCVEPKCSCWTIEDYMRKSCNLNETLRGEKKLIKLNEKEKFDLLNLENFNDLSEYSNKAVKVVKSFDSRDSLSSIMTNFSLNNEINYFKKKPSKCSIENKISDELFDYSKFVDELRKSVETGKSSLNDSKINEAIFNLGIDLSEISTCSGSIDSEISQKHLNIDTTN